MKELASEKEKIELSDILDSLGRVSRMPRV